MHWTGFSKTGSDPANRHRKAENQTDPGVIDWYGDQGRSDLE